MSDEDPPGGEMLIAVVKPARRVTRHLDRAEQG
jgi:hypothetical protein